MLQRRKPLLRKTPLRRTNFLRSAAPTSADKSRTSGLRRVSKKRAAELRLYSAARKRYLSAHPICEVWCRERKFQLLGPGPTGEILYQSAYPLANFTATELLNLDAPRATEIHHMNKRRGKMLLDENFWLAVSHASHERIEMNKAWAREQGLLLNF